MNKVEVFAIIFKRNQDAIMNAVEGLNHSEGLLQLPGESNCMNWVLGHIATYRDGMLADIGLDEYMSEDEVALYGSGSSAITIDSPAVDFERLVELQQLTFDGLDDWFQSDPGDLEKETRSDMPYKKGYSGYWNSVIEHLAQMTGHESVHVGELSALRELALVSKTAK
jgi:hypothetical protein